MLKPKPIQTERNVMTTDERLRLTLVSELDQLTAGLDRGDEPAILDARTVLAHVARDGSPNLLAELFRCIVLG
jgi:hypothetical protein